MPNMIQYLEEDFPKNLSIDVGAKHSFKNYAKLNSWFEQEEKFYQSIGNPGNTVHSLNQYVKNQLRSKFNQNRNENFTAKELLEELKTFIESTFTSHGIIASKSKIGIWLQKQHKENPSLTLGSFSYFQNKLKGVSNNTTTQRDGEFSAYLFDSGLQPDFETEKKQYSSFYAEVVEQKDEILKELVGIREENKILNQTITKQNADWESTFTNQKEEVAKRFNDEYDRHKSKMTESEDFYEKKLAVKSAVTYWAKKAESHKTNSFIFGIIAGFLMILSLIGIVILGKYIINLDLTDSNGIGRKILTETGALQLWVYGFFIVCMTLVIWFIRLLVKVFLSNLHLLSDAKERETMIKTYLAFEREENTLKDTDRDLILPSIFRVSTNGFIKEDSTPNSPINIITKKFTE